MPRRKKNGQSPARVPGGPPEGGSLGHNTGYKVPQGFDGAMANNFPSSPALSSSAKEGIVKSMQEMFSHLDREVIYIVLSECDFKGIKTRKATYPTCFVTLGNGIYLHGANRFAG